MNNATRYFLVSFKNNTGGGGSIWFDYPGYPSAKWLKQTIVKKFGLDSVAIMNIHEFNEEDFKAFNSE